MKTTKKHFEIFKKECRKWIDYFELNNWKVDFIHIKLERKVVSEATMNLSGYAATIRLNTIWAGSRELNSFEIERSAKHEVMHLLLARMSVNGKERFIDSADLEEAEEEIVRKLENILK